MSRIAVIGAGAWGTALAISLARRRGHAVALWSHRAELAEEMRETGVNRAYLPGAVVPMDVVVTSELEVAVAEADFVLCVTPSEHMRGVVGRIAPMLTRDQMVVSATKGLEEGSAAADVAGDRFGDGECVLRAERAFVCGGGGDGDSDGCGGCGFGARAWR